MRCTRKQRRVLRGGPWTNWRSSRRRSLRCRTTFGITRSWASFTNCFTSKIQRNLHSRRFGTYRTNWSQPLRMPAAVPSIFAIDSNPKKRAKCERLPFWFAPSSKRSGWKTRPSRMIQILANSLVPIFVGLLFGYAAGLFKIVDNKDVKSLVSFLMTFALPCSLFVAIARTPDELLWGQAKPAIVLAIVYVAVFVATYYASRNLGKDTAANSAVLALTLGFPNHAGVGIPLLLAVYGAKASVTVAVGLAVGAITITPITLAILESGTSTGRTLSLATRIRISLWRALKKPVFWAPVLGVLASVVKFHMPIYLDKSLTIVGDATEGTALFVTGLIVSAQRFSLNWGVGGAVLGKNVIQPALCLAIALLLGMSPEQTRFVVLLSAIPSGFFGILFGKGFDATPEVASSSLIASTVFSIFTLAGWIIVLSHSH